MSRGAMKNLSGALVLGLSAGVFGSLAFAPQAESQGRPIPGAVLLELDSALQGTTARARKAVVGIIAQQRLIEDEKERVHTISLSGTVWDDEGQIVTFGHSLQGATEILVRPADEPEDASWVPARLIGVDPQTHLALLQAELGTRAQALPRVPLASRRPLRPGALALAVGNPYGLFGSARLANVAGVGRRMSYGSVTTERAIEISAPVNPGDPGGLVADVSGQLLGIMASSLRQAGTSSAQDAINALLEETRERRDVESRERLLAELSRVSALSSAQGIGFVIALEDVEAAVARIREEARRERVWLGVRVTALPGAWREKLEKDGLIAADEGVIVVGVVSDSPAREAGLQYQDIVLRWGDQAINDVRQLEAQVLKARPGDSAEVKVLRGGELVKLKVVLKARANPIKPPVKEGE